MISSFAALSKDAWDLTGKSQIFFSRKKKLTHFWLLPARGKIDNIVGSGMLYQDGVHLANLLHAEDANVDFDPGAFPNAIYRNTLPDGTVFCSNIASTQKVVTMGVKSPRALYKAYKMTSAVVNDFEGEVWSFSPAFLWGICPHKKL